MKVVTEMSTCSGVVLPKPFSLDVKRFYIPGVTIEDKCPKCGEIAVKNLNHDYVSFPDANAVNDVEFYCSDCNHDWYGQVLLKLSVETLPGAIE